MCLDQMNILAQNVASLLNIECDTADWGAQADENSEPMVGFYPKETSQDCPEVLEAIDAHGDWEPRGTKHWRCDSCYYRGPRADWIIMTDPDCPGVFCPECGYKIYTEVEAR